MSDAALMVDSHQHFWDPERGDYPWMVGSRLPIRRTFGPDDLRPALKDSGVDATVLVQTWSSVEETWELLQTASATDFVAGVVGWVDLTQPGVGETIDELRASVNGRYLVGIRHQVHDEPDGEWLLRPEVRRGLVEVERSGLVYDLLVRPRELPAAVRVAREQPRLSFVIDHIAKPDIARGEIDGWAAALAPLGELSNVSCKLSGMVTEANWQSWTPDDLRPYVERVLEIFGARRTLVGSDWPVCLLAGSYIQVLEGLRTCIDGLSAAEKERILGLNAIEAYGLSNEVGR